MAEAYHDVALRSLRIGTVLHAPILQPNNVLLVAAGTVLTERLFQLLEQRGIDQVRVHDVDLAAAREEQAEKQQIGLDDRERFYREVRRSKDPLTPRRNLFRTTTSRRLDQQIAEAGVLTRMPGVSQVFVRGHAIDDLSTFHADLARQQKQDAERVEQCQQIHQLSTERRRIIASDVQRFVERELLLLGRDPHFALFVPRPPDSSPYPGAHSFLVTRLSIALAARLGWTREEILGVGAGALCHDVGMLQISDKLYRNRSRLGSLERHDLIKHPVFSLDTVGLDTTLHPYAPFIAYQTHERLDGSGYPRGYSAGAVHPAARLVGLVDAYVGMISDRLHREPDLPHQALLRLMLETKTGLWDASMIRGFVSMLSLYPPGSFVELTDGRVARTVHATDDERRPVVEAWYDPAATAHEPGELLDLATEEDAEGAQVARATWPPQMV